ncbi:hypothetical protein [Candidatus Binatus sp.]|uniref:hypothetical protein n=1 Tax=Candidatus Binatus sp. TaxID=2811406 RepID=UPI003F963EFD
MPAARGMLRKNNPTLKQRMRRHRIRGEVHPGPGERQLKWADRIDADGVADAPAALSEDSKCRAQ